MKERDRKGLHAQPRKDKDKKPKKPNRYNRDDSGPDRVRKYYCAEHDREHVLTPKQITGEKPVKCNGHEFNQDFRDFDRIMETW